MSALLLDGVMAVWIRAVQQRVPGAVARSYMDDQYTTVYSYDDLVLVRNEMEKFARLTGLKFNLLKSYLFTTAPHTPRLTLNGTGLSWKPHFDCLGAMVNTTRGRLAPRHFSPRIRRRMEEACAVARNISK